MDGRGDPVLIEKVCAVWFDRAVHACRLPPGIVGRNARGDAAGIPFAAGDTGPSTVRVLALMGIYGRRVVKVVALCGPLSNDEFTFLVVFTDDYGLLSRLREQFAMPAVWAQIDAGAGHVSVTAELFGDQTRQKDSQVAEAAHLGEVLAFDFSLERRLAAPGHLSRSLNFRQLFQIRDAERPDLAHTDAVAEGSLDVERMQVEPNGTSIPNFRSALIRGVSIGSGRNLDFVADLGLAPEDRAEFPGGAARDLRITLRAEDPIDLVRRHRAFYEPRMDPRTPPPYVFDDVVSTGFKFTANRKHLDAIVDALLNAPDGGRGGIACQNFRYVVASTEVVLEYLEYGSMRSTAPETSERRDEDVTSQFELCLRLIVGAIEEDGEAASDPMVFCPLLFVDNWASMVSGREVMGYWKRMAEFKPARGSPCAEDLRKRLWPHARFDVTEEGQWGPEDRTRTITEEVTRRICALGADDDPIVQIRHALDRAALREDYRKPGRVGIGDGRRLLPWRQTDFSDPRFRRQFARDWLRVSGESFDTIQRPFLAVPGPNGQPPKGGWIRTRNTVRDFRVVQPEGEAELDLGKFEDGELAARLYDSKSPVLRAAKAVVPGSPQIDLAKLLGVSDGAIKIPPSDWYLASGSFDVKVIDRLA